MCVQFAFRLPLQAAFGFQHRYETYPRHCHAIIANRTGAHTVFFGFACRPVRDFQSVCTGSCRATAHFSRRSRSSAAPPRFWSTHRVLTPACAGRRLSGLRASLRNRTANQVIEGAQCGFRSFTHGDNDLFVGHGRHVAGSEHPG